MQINRAWEEWAEALRQIGGNGVLPIDAAVFDCVVALNVLGLPTLGSCGGHPWHGGDDEIRFPFVAIRHKSVVDALPAERLLTVWRDEGSATAAERHALATVAWTRHRPMARSLRQWYRAFLDQGSRDGRFGIEASWRGVFFNAQVESWCEDPQSSDIARLNATISGFTSEIASFGSWLRTQTLAGRLALPTSYFPDEA